MEQYKLRWLSQNKKRKETKINQKGDYTFSVVSIEDFFISVLKELRKYILSRRVVSWRRISGWGKYGKQVFNSTRCLIHG